MAARALLADPTTLFDIPDTHTDSGRARGLPALLRDTRPVDDATTGDGFGWFADLLTPTPPPACVRCGHLHVYRAPAGFVLACPVCFPTEATA
ncbi:hypothetical protein ACN27J_03200 [Solwaraspora sp. WMMB762]|uniref:hypothetical protein n=1 Tax=Solwaraspora sp. WMMB762 TaxID=3404120 RepID=UPI003B9485E7